MGESGSRNLADDGLLDARGFIRGEQRAAAARIGAGPGQSADAALLGTLSELHRVRAFEATPDPGLVRRGPFRYERALEERRIRLAEAIIQRVEPGPFEDPSYLALLAYQAASVELAFSPRDDSDRAETRWSRFLIGIIPSAEVNAFATVRERGGYTVVAVHAALVDFIFQAAKAVVAAQRPARSRDVRSSVTAEGDAERVRAALDLDDGPARHLHRTLEAYLFHGRTRAEPHEEIPDEHSPPLSILIAMAERFVVAHEYGHGAMALRSSGGSQSNPAWTAEFQADNFAMFATVLSAHRLDHLPPEFALGGALFALGCLDLLRQAVCAARDGSVPDDVGSDTHPPNAWRAQRVVTGFHELFEVEYGAPTEPPRLLVIDPADRRGEPDESLRNVVYTRANAQARILFVLWERALPMLLAEHAAQRRLHPMWYGAA